VPGRRSPEAARFLQALGHAVLLAREQAELSQEALGARSGHDQTYISGIERGVRNPTATSLLKIGKALGVGAAALLRRAEERERTSAK
jgi:transcriptional regulator with XRE-family HTH domain